MLRRLALILLPFVGLAVCSGCLVAVEEEPPGLAHAMPTKTAPSQAWLVMAGEKALGMVVRFAENPGGRTFLTVRNQYGQDLGMIDALGRAWRHRPHRAEAEWILTGTVIEGVSGILAAGNDLRLDEVPVTSLASVSALYAAR